MRVHTVVAALVAAACMTMSVAAPLRAQRLEPVAARASNSSPRESVLSARRDGRPSVWRYAGVGAAVGVVAAGVAWSIWAETDAAKQECIGCEFVVAYTVAGAAILGGITGAVVWAIRY